MKFELKKKRKHFEFLFKVEDQAEFIALNEFMRAIIYVTKMSSWGDTSVFSETREVVFEFPRRQRIKELRVPIDRFVKDYELDVRREHKIKIKDAKNGKKESTERI